MAERPGWRPGASFLWLLSTQTPRRSLEPALQEVGRARGAWTELLLPSGAQVLDVVRGRHIRPELLPKEALDCSFLQLFTYTQFIPAHALTYTLTCIDT